MKIVLALAVMLSINMFLFLGQLSVENIAINELGTPSGSNFFNYEGSFISEYNEGVEGEYVGKSNITLPEVEGSISPDTGNFFVDPIGSLKGFFKTVGKGFSYSKMIVTAVPTFLAAIGLPPAVSFALGFFWNGLTLFLLIMLVWGRQL
ncbi:MAG: hypothetical protein GY853_02150 [PVC group bacterium]|nr:hypothetical protein [PVC group bacterium]